MPGGAPVARPCGRMPESAVGVVLRSRDSLWWQTLQGIGDVDRRAVDWRHSVQKWGRLPESMLSQVVCLQLAAQHRCAWQETAPLWMRFCEGRRRKMGGATPGVSTGRLRRRTLATESSKSVAACKRHAVDLCVNRSGGPFGLGTPCKAKHHSSQRIALHQGPSIECDQGSETSGPGCGGSYQKGNQLST